MKYLVFVLSVVVASMSLAHAISRNTSSPSIIPLDNELGNGTYISAKENSTDNMTLLGQDNCLNHSVMAQPNVFGFVGLVKDATRKFCEPSDRNMVATRFAAADCTKASTCRHSVGKSDANIKDADGILNEIIAKDYLKNSLLMYGEDMERLEALTRFAQKQYDTKLGAQCIARFQRKSVATICNPGFAEETFLEHQKSCTGGYGCFRSDDKDSGVSSFENFRISHDDSKGKYMYDYYKYRVETKFDKDTNSDESKLAALGELVSSAKFKALSLDAKIARFTAEIGMENDGRLKDPVLGYDMGSGSKEPKRFIASEKFKEVLKLLQDKNVTAKSFVSDYDGIRKKRAQVLLSNKEVCESTPTFISICSDATKLLKGDSIKKDANFADRITSARTTDDTYIDRVKKIIGNDFNDDYFETLVNARRCISFGLSDEKGNPIIRKETASSAGGKNRGDSKVTAASDAEELELRGVKPEITTAELQGPNMKGVWDEAVSKNNVDKVLNDPSEKATGSTESIASNFDKIEPATTTTPTTAPAMANNFNDLFNTSGFDSFAGKDKSKVDDSAAKPESVSDSPAGKAVVPDKTTEYLMKKLAAAEENLEKLKAESEAAEKDRAKQKKVDEETALIKDLKGQISDLKTQTAKNTAKKIADESSAAEARTQSLSRSNNSAQATIIGSHQSDLGVIAPAAESFDTNRAASAAIAAGAARSIASTSGAILSSVTNNDGSKTVTLGSGLIVTTVDGMSAEKAAITISNRIFELNGTPFYIEEGGVVKEIIAVVKDGKVLLDEKGNPVFEKIVKGKVGDKKFAKSKDKDRAPASITDNADLKRDQEEKLKRERAEYLKLKNLTNGALNKK